MKIKKYEAVTEQEAIEKVKQELGLDALILNIKKTEPKGIFAFFRKPLVEVTAAFDEKKAVQEEKPEFVEPSGYFENRIIASEQNEKIKNLEKQLSSTEGMLEKAVSRLSISQYKEEENKRRFENSLVQLFYDALVSQGVLEEIAENILEDISLVEDEIDLTTVVKVVYNKIVNIIGVCETAPKKKAKRGKPKVQVFIGPTGVGKTTTIAKLSSTYILEDALNVAFITADTYRIAAVEQLKTYAEILGIEIGVVYNNEDLLKSIKSLSGINDVLMVDTAGRSHKNEENLNELKVILEAIPNTEQFLVLSTTTKFEDLYDIVNVYSEFTNFNIIFTKLDETSCLGSILNICYLTDKKVAYLTNGQNVPDDIEKIQPEKIAKALMGLGGATS